MNEDVMLTWNAKYSQRQLRNAISTVLYTAMHQAVEIMTSKLNTPTNTHLHY